MPNIGKSRLRQTPSQTAGPFVHIGLAPASAGFDIYDRPVGRAMIGPGTPGQRIRVEGAVWDGMGAPVKDALIEVWQADAQGRYPDQPGAFRGWGRVVPDLDTGTFAFDTVKPGAVAGRGDTPQAPHLCLWMVARGINVGLHTRLYFSDEAEANAADPVLGLIEWEHRRATLIATRADGDPPTYRFDIRLQGPDETVFFDL